MPAVPSAMPNAGTRPRGNFVLRRRSTSCTFFDLPLDCLRSIREIWEVTLLPLESHPLGFTGEPKPVA